MTVRCWRCNGPMLKGIDGPECMHCGFANTPARRAPTASEIRLADRAGHEGTKRPINPFEFECLNCLAHPGTLCVECRRDAQAARP